MQSTEWEARLKERNKLFYRILVENELHAVTTKYNKAVLEHQAAMEELQKIIYESKK